MRHGIRNNSFSCSHLVIKYPYSTLSDSKGIVGHLTRSVGPKIEDFLSVTVELKGKNETLRVAPMSYTSARATARLHVRFPMESLFLPQTAPSQMV